MTTDTTAPESTEAADDGPSLDDLIAASERELTAAERIVLDDADIAPPPQHPLGDAPTTLRVEIVDGRRMSVPVDPEHREAFFARRAERAEADAKARAEHEAIVSEYLSLSPLERARKYNDREAAAIEDMLPKTGGSPV